MAFVSLGILELVHSFNIRSEGSIFNMNICENKYLIGAFLLGTLLQVSVVIIPSVAKVFELIPLTTTQWLYTTVISLLPIIIMEIQKKSIKEQTVKVIMPNSGKNLNKIKIAQTK